MHRDGLLHKDPANNVHLEQNYLVNIRPLTTPPPPYTLFWIKKSEISSEFYLSIP